jgi:hypothetical protein
MADSNSDLTLPISNQYASGSITKVDTNYYLERKTLIVTPKIGDRWHVITSGDRLDLLAYNYYKNYVADSTRLWWILADANKINNPFNLETLVGNYFLIPDYYRVQQLIAQQDEIISLQDGDLVVEQVGDLVNSSVTTSTPQYSI